MYWQIYIIIAITLYSIVHFSVGLLDIEIKESPDQLCIILYCAAWPISIAVLLVITILYLISVSTFTIGKTIRKFLYKKIINKKAVQ